MSKSPETKWSNYPTTQWTRIIDVIQNGGDDESLAALGELFTNYKPAVECFFKRLSPEKAEDLTSEFFERCVLTPWNRRHGQLSPLYSTEEIRQLNKLGSVFAAHSHPVADFLWNSFSDSTRQLLSNIAGNESPPNETCAALASELNAILQGSSIYEEKRFAKVKLSAESRNLLKRENLDGNWLVWLNRSLLGDAFPRLLTKGIGFLYIVEQQGSRRFRAFLAHAMWWFLKDDWKMMQTKKAGGGDTPLSLDEIGELGFEIPFECTEFGMRFDRDFARQIMALAMGRSKHSRQIEAHLRGLISQKQAAEELGLSENAFRQSYSRFRQRLADGLQAEVSKITGPDENEIRAETEYLMGLLADNS